MYDELAAQSSLKPGEGIAPRLDTSAAKVEFQSEMMRRDNYGDSATDAAGAIAPIVVGKVFTPAESAQGLGIGKMARTLPQGMSEAQFAEFSKIIKESKAGEYGTDIRVHGSRAAGTAKQASDIDVAIRVPKEKFDQLIGELFTKAKPGNAIERTMNHAIKAGKIRRTDLDLSDLGKELAAKFGLPKVDISVVREGGAFDQGPWISLK